MSTSLRALLAATAVTSFAVGVGVLVAAPTVSGPLEPVAPEVTSLAAIDTTTVVLARAEFCERVADETVTAALGEEAATSTSYGNGEQAAVTDDVTDVAHEYSCAFETAEGVEARAWVFAPPVTRAKARKLVDGAAEVEGCEPLADAAEFGRAGGATTCEIDGDEELESTYRGLFGDAWFSCSLTGSDRVELEKRLDGWCAGLLMTLTLPADG